MICTGTLRGLARPCTLVVAVATGLVLTPPASAQQRMFVMEQDDGSGSEITHISLPDMAGLRTPDFVRADLPIFEDRLRLDAAQVDAVTAHLEAYLEQFNALALERLPAGPRNVMFAQSLEGGGGDFTFDLGPGIDDILEEGDLEPGSNVAVAITIGGDGGMGGNDVDVTGGGGAPGVFIAVESADGEISDEMRERLEQQAAEMAEEMQRRMDAGEMVGPDPATSRQRMADRMAHMEEMTAAAEEFRREKETLRRSFEASVQGELATEQFERWPALERTLVRTKTLPTGQLSGETSDLIGILEDLDFELDAESPVTELALAYELELHDALTRRNRFVDEANRKVDEALQNGDGQTALELVERATSLRTAVRDINKRYAEALAVVAGEKQPEFQARVRTSMWSRVYRRTRAERAYEQARRLEGITEEKLLQILELETAFRAELENINAGLVRTIDREEPLERVRMMEQVADSLSGAGEPGMMRFGGDDAVRDAFSKRKDFERRSMEQLYALLTPEQVATLPKIRSAEEGEPFIIRFGGSEDN